MNKLSDKDMDLMFSILKEVWKQNPDLRLGQLLLNLNKKWLRDFYYISDNVLYYNLVKEYYEEKENKMKSWLLKIRDMANLGIANDTYTPQEMIQKLEQIYNFTWECEKKLKSLAKGE